VQDYHNKIILTIISFTFVVSCQKKKKNYSNATRKFSITYTVNLNSHKIPLKLFVPIPRETYRQKILKMTLPKDGKLQIETVYKNRFWYKVIPATMKKSSFNFIYLIERKPYRFNNAVVENHNSLQKYLQANKRVPIKGGFLDEVLKNIPTNGNQYTVALNIFNFVINNMEYKKTGSGWGHGDTFWACSEKYGNCTDFHALFTSLSRARGIATRFKVGFSIPTNRNIGNITGYHCWAEFHIKGKGWLPVDASEAWKHKKQKGNYFAKQSSDRIFFTQGRDLRLSRNHKTSKLNYFVYPHVETVNLAKKWNGHTIKVSYESLL